MQSASQLNQAYDLGDGYEIRDLDRRTFNRDFRDLHQEIFRDSGLIKLSSRSPFPDAWVAFWGLYYQNKAAGWSVLQEREPGMLQMMNSALLADHRGKGLYKKMLQLVIEKARENKMLRIESAHRLDNNAIIIPKLQAGFMIKGTELSASTGALVRLVYFLEEKERKAFKLRCGKYLNQD